MVEELRSYGVKELSRMLSVQWEVLLSILWFVIFFLRFYGVKELCG